METVKKIFRLIRRVILWGSIAYFALLSMAFVWGKFFPEKGFAPLTVVISDRNESLYTEPDVEGILAGLNQSLKELVLKKLSCKKVEQFTLESNLSCVNTEIIELDSNLSTAEILIVDNDFNGTKSLHDFWIFQIDKSIIIDEEKNKSKLDGVELLLSRESSIVPLTLINKKESKWSLIETENNATQETWTYEDGIYMHKP